MLATCLFLALVQDPAPPPTVADPALRDELRQRMKAEQDVRTELMKVAPGGPSTEEENRRPEVQAILVRMAAIDRDNLAWFKGVVREKGWPGKAMVGPDGATGAFLIVQHATSDLEFMAECLPMLRAAYEAGDAEGQWVALLTDRLRILRDKKPQLYGSQLEFKDGRLVPQPIEDEAHVDDRRAAMGMPPLADYLAMVSRAQAPEEVPAIEPGFTPLFNGEDLTGWRHDGESLDGQESAADGRFAVKDGVLVITGSDRTPPVMDEIDTADTFDGDFTLRFEFRAHPEANSGLHLRDKVFAHQLQVRDYPNVGPYKDLEAYKPDGWNAVEVVVTGTTARATCNGEVLEEALAIPESGPLSLQSELGVVEYRNLRVKTSK